MTKFVPVLVNSGKNFECSAVDEMRGPWIFQYGAVYEMLRPRSRRYLYQLLWNLYILVPQIHQVCR